MCRQQSRVRLTPEEQLAAEESLSVYCKPVELYNILQRRAIRNVSSHARILVPSYQSVIFGLALYVEMCSSKHYFDPALGRVGF